MKKQSKKLVKGWTEKQLRDLAAHYDNQSEEDAVAEDEAAFASTRHTIMAIPIKLVPKVQKLIDRRAS